DCLPPRRCCAGHVDGTLVHAGQRGMDPAAAERFGRIGIDDDLPGSIALRERRTLVSPSIDDWVQRFPHLRDTPRSAPGFVAVPLVSESDPLGVLVFGFGGPPDEADA